MSSGRRPWGIVCQHAITSINTSQHRLRPAQCSPRQVNESTRSCPVKIVYCQTEGFRGISSHFWLLLVPRNPSFLPRFRWSIRTFLLENRAFLGCQNEGFHAISCYAYRSRFRLDFPRFPSLSHYPPPSPSSLFPCYLHTIRATPWAPKTLANTRVRLIGKRATGVRIPGDTL